MMCIYSFKTLQLQVACQHFKEFAWNFCCAQCKPFLFSFVIMSNVIVLNGTASELLCVCKQRPCSLERACARACVCVCMCVCVCVFRIWKWLVTKKFSVWRWIISTEYICFGIFCIITYNLITSFQRLTFHWCIYFEIVLNKTSMKKKKCMIFN